MDLRLVSHSFAWRPATKSLLCCKLPPSVWLSLLRTHEPFAWIKCFVSAFLQVGFFPRWALLPWWQRWLSATAVSHSADQWAKQRSHLLQKSCGCSHWGGSSHKPIPEPITLTDLPGLSHVPAPARSDGQPSGLRGGVGWLPQSKMWVLRSEEGEMGCWAATNNRCLVS